MEIQKLLFIFNPKSGKGLIKNHLTKIVDIMVKAGFEVTIYTTQAVGDATKKVEEDGAGYDRIICSGGDGTLDEVVTGMRNANLTIPLGYIPAGSTNDFARSLGISNDMVKAAQIAVGEHTFVCDVGKFNEDIFVYIAAFGIFTEISYETPQELKNVLGHLAYLLSAAKSLATIPNYLMKIEVEGQQIEDKFIYGMITNSISVGGFKGMTGKDVQLDDGEFEVTLIKSPTNPIELNEILACLTNLIDNSDLIYSFKTKKIKIVSEKKVPWTLDGEFGGEHEEVVIENLCKKIQIVVDKEKV
ncbi:MAG: YegS/Rv2252/BmrU family lipid kinase [Lachnospiraceae bacterium]|nr:YegS/Rv2252/BmrU family lipid kinase [Lachnospiraceae bacterium]